MVLGNTGRGGSQTYVMNILRNIDSSRFSIDFAVYQDLKNGYGKEIREKGCKIWIVPQFNILNYFQCIRAWKTVLENGQYDIIHGHATNAAFIYLKLAKQFGCKTIVHSHSAGFRGKKIEQLIKHFFSSKAKQYADYWFSCSEKASKKLYGSQYKTYKNYYTLPNAINVEKYLFDSAVKTRIIKDNHLENCFVCGHVGSFSLPKNHKYLLKIFEQILVRNQSARLLLCGDGPIKKDIDLYIKSHKLDGKVILTGNIPNVDEYMMAMDVLIFPSLFEGLPVTIVEAQATGLPIIMSDVITKEVILTDLVHTMSLDDKPSDWAKKALECSADNRIKYNSIINNSVFNMTKSIQTLMNLYEKIRNE